LSHFADGRLGAAGFTKPSAPVDYPIAAKVMKAALEQGANFWNGVSESLAVMKPHAIALTNLRLGNSLRHP